MTGRPPNVLYLHSHDTGRHLEPYGYPVPTPNIQQLASQGIVFREAFCAVPTCSGSRAALVTGQYGHNNGMLGLAHRGFALRDYGEHVVHTLREGGYWSAMIGEQHIATRPDVIGYDRVVKVETTHVESVAPIAIELIASGPPEPWFFSVGFFETHREFFAPSSVGDVLYSRPPENIPDHPDTRRDMASYKASARSLDQGIGAVLAALDHHKLVDDTLVIYTTDHGLAFPGAKATLYDRGIGVALIMRGPGGFEGGRVIDGLVSHLDIYPTLCDLAGLEHPPFLQGRSLLPLARRMTDEIRDVLFAEATFHAAYEPQRAVRTQRHKYIRRFGDRETPVLANTDDGPSKDLLMARGWAQRRIPFEQLYDLAFDPTEAANLATDPDYADIRRELADRLERWMHDTDDPLLHGPVTPPPGAELNLPDQVSPADPTVIARPVG
jgi:N-sulfoglucosamine sulfohydrolase